MYKRIFLIAAIAVLSACASQKPRPPVRTAPVPPPTSQQTPPATIEVSGSEQRIIEATNAFRIENKLAPLKPKVQLIITAQNHARNMARQDKFGDTDKNGHVLDSHGFDYRVQASGYPFERVAENVGYQLRHQDAVGDMMTDWKKSPGHRRNMLIPELTEIGTGAAQGKSGRWYFVQVFGRPLPAKQTQVDDVFVVAQQRH